MIDSAFPGFADLVRMMTNLDGGCRDAEQGVAAHIYEVALDVPIELSIARDGAGRLQIGASPPLYREHTSYLPSFHAIRLVACRVDAASLGAAGLGTDDAR